MIIYKTTNLKNGKFYIGKDAKNKKSYLGSGVILKQAIKKYGKENFKKEIIEYCTDLKHLDEREQYWISFYSAIENGYNLTIGGTGGNTHLMHIPNDWGFKKGSTPWNKGIPMSEEVKEKLSKLMKSKNTGPNKTSYKPGIEHIMYGTKQKEETVMKRVETRRKNGSYIGFGKFASKQVKNIVDNKIFNSIKEAAAYYNINRGIVSHSCRKNTKKGIFRFV